MKIKINEAKEAVRKSKLEKLAEHYETSTEIIIYSGEEKRKLQGTVYKNGGQEECRVTENKEW